MKPVLQRQHLGRLAALAVHPMAVGKIRCGRRRLEHRWAPAAGACEMGASRVRREVIKLAQLFIAGRGAVRNRSRA